MTINNTLHQLYLQKPLISVYFCLFHYDTTINVELKIHCIVLAVDKIK